MKRLLLILMFCLACASCAKAENYTIPFETGGKVYKLALLPWQATAMDFDFKYRWRMTQSILNACKQSGAFELKWSTYAVNGGDVTRLEDVEKANLWERRKYGKVYPVVSQVQAVLSGTDADLALLYDISAGNTSDKRQTMSNSRSDSIRLYLVDVKTGRVVTEFDRTSFPRSSVTYTIKQVTLRALNKWLNQ